MARQCLAVIKQHLAMDGGQESPQLYYSKSDLKSAFHLAPILPRQRFLLIMKCVHPTSNQTFFFIEKCLPFGVSRSCKIFSEISEGLHHITERIIGTNCSVN